MTNDFVKKVEISPRVPSQEDMVRKIMIDIIKTKYCNSKEIPIIKLIECPTISKDLCNIALLQIKKRMKEPITKENYEDAKKFLQEDEFKVYVPLLQYYEDWINRSGDGTDEFGRYELWSDSFHSYKKEDGEYIFWYKKYSTFPNGGPCNSRTKIFNNSGLQIAEVYTWGRTTSQEKGYILTRPERIVETTDIYSLDYKRYDGKIIIDDDGSIDIDKNATVQNHEKIYIPIGNIDPCFIPSTDEFKYGELPDRFLHFPSDKGIEARFNVDSNNPNWYFKNLPQVMNLRSRGNR